MGTKRSLAVPSVASLTVNDSTNAAAGTASPVIRRCVVMSGGLKVTAFPANPDRARSAWNAGILLVTDSPPIPLENI